MNVKADNTISIHSADELPLPNAMQVKAPEAAQHIDCLICPFYENAVAFNDFPVGAATMHHLSSVLVDEKFTGKLGELVMVHAWTLGEFAATLETDNPDGSRPQADTQLSEGHLSTPSMSQKRIKKYVFVGLGKQSDSGAPHFRKAFKTVFEALTKQAMNHFGLYISNALINHDDAILDASVHCFSDAEYRFDRYKTSTEANSPRYLKVFSTRYAELALQLPYLLAEQSGMQLTKDLANMPANDCTPDYLAAQCKWLDASFEKISTTILDEQALFDLSMHSYLAVNRASSYQASMPVMRYTGADQNQAPIVLIGKGVTFDTGGISLKGAAGMEAMIYDMAGAATVFGVMHAIASLDLPINLIVILATAENCIDGSAYRPGDVLSTMSGKTVEVISTDAEGRLLLCDAISYAKSLKPACIVDIATLTGAAITSLGHHASGLMCNDDNLQLALLAAGKSRHDRAWAFPIWEEYMDALRSTCADMKNTGSNSPGMITAACFLSKFAKGVPWAHLDIAGTSFIYGKQNTASARPLPLLLKFVMNQASANR